MYDIAEAFRILEEMADEDEKHEMIYIDVLLPDSLEERLLTGSILDRYDEQAVEEWFDFAMTIEGIVSSNCDVVNISMSNNPMSVSEYIDFYILDDNGNRKNYMVDMRLSDHSSSSKGKYNRKKHANAIDPNNIFIGVTINDKVTEFKSYLDAEKYVRDKIKELQE